MGVVATVQEFTISDALWERLAAQSAAGAKKTGSNPTDRAKGGVKCSLLTDARGIPGALVLDGDNLHYMNLLASTLTNLPPATEAARATHRATGSEQGLCLDAGYDSG